MMNEIDARKMAETAISYLAQDRNFSPGVIDAAVNAILPIPPHKKRTIFNTMTRVICQHEVEWPADPHDEC